MVVVGILVWALGPEVLRVPWNPWITILPLFAVLALAWDATAGGLWSYPFAVAGGSFIVQSHVGYAAVTLAILAGAAAIVLGRALRGQVAWRAVVVVGLVALGTLAVLWAPPLYQQLARRARQPERAPAVLLRFADRAHPRRRHLGDLPRARHRSRSAHGDRRRGRANRAGAPAWAGTLTLLALGAAIVVAALRRAWSALSLAGLVVLSIVAAVVVDGARHRPDRGLPRPLDRDRRRGRVDRARRRASSRPDRSPPRASRCVSSSPPCSRCRAEQLERVAGRAARADRHARGPAAHPRASRPRSAHPRPVRSSSARGASRAGCWPRPP